MIYDLEQMIRDTETLFKAKLNTEIVLINTQKNDSIVLDQIPADQYVIFTLDDRVNNFKTPWIQIGIADTPLGESSLETAIEKNVITIQVALFDINEKERKNTFYKLLRYQKAIKQVLLKNPDLFQGYSSPLMQSLPPAAFPLDSRLIILTMGVNITATITSN